MNLLLDSRPLIVIPELAELLGDVDQAIILQQIHYWLQKSSNKIDGHVWVYNSMKKKKKQFPWIKSRKSLANKFKKLEDRGLLITGNYNQAGFDKTKWYSVDYSTLSNLGNALGKNYPTIGSKLPNGMGKNYPTNTIDYTETTTETNYSTSISDKPEIDYVGIVSYLNESTGKNYRATTPKTRTLIRARFKEGFKSEDFKKVVDNKVAEWQGDQKMSKFLRPETLFGTKFESYLNDEPKQQVRDDSYTYF